MTKKSLNKKYLYGIVNLNISKRQEQVNFQVSWLNLTPLEMTKFSKQFVPDLANCSLSCLTHHFKCVYKSSISIMLIMSKY